MDTPRSSGDGDEHRDARRPPVAPTGQPPADVTGDEHSDVDEASEDSFPASDAPPWSGLEPGGPRR